MENDQKLNLDTNIACDLKIYPDLEIWLLVQVQGQWKRNGAS